MDQKSASVYRPAAAAATDAAATLSQARVAVGLRIDAVGKTFIDGERVVEALHPTSITIAPGEFVCLLGPSGCGKSTLLNMIAGLEPPTTGTIYAGETPITRPGADRALMFQDAALFPWLDVNDNIAFGLRQKRVPRAERDAIVARLVAMVHLTGFERSAVHRLSGGMRQRVALARALAIDPAILLMDEPFGALDALTRDRMHHELESIWGKTHTTVVFVTHNVREAVALGDRVLLFAPRPGRLVAEFPVTMPRTRRLEDHDVVELTRTILDELHRTDETEAA